MKNDVMKNDEMFVMFCDSYGLKRIYFPCRIVAERISFGTKEYQFQPIGGTGLNWAKEGRFFNNMEDVNRHEAKQKYH